MRFLRVLSLIVSLSFFIIGCGGVGDGGGGDTTYKIAEYYPLGQGDTWTYRETEDGNTSTFTRTVSGTETIGGVLATKVLEGQIGDYKLWTVDSKGVTLYKEYEVENGGWEQRVFNPPLNFLSAKVFIGTKKTINSTMNYTNSEGETETETISGEATVEGIEAVTVPAGTFNNCLKIKLNATITSADGTMMIEVTMLLAKGVGMVKEISKSSEPGEPVETFVMELLSATVGGVSYP